MAVHSSDALMRGSTLSLARALAGMDATAATIIKAGFDMRNSSPGQGGSIALPGAKRKGLLTSSGGDRLVALSIEAGLGLVDRLDVVHRPPGEAANRLLQRL